MAKEFGADPGLVLDWEPWRLGLAFDCIEARNERRAESQREAIARGANVTYTISLG